MPSHSAGNGSLSSRRLCHFLSVASTELLQAFRVAGQAPRCRDLSFKRCSRGALSRSTHGLLFYTSSFLLHPCRGAADQSSIGSLSAIKSFIVWISSGE